MSPIPVESQVMIVGSAVKSSRVLPIAMIAIFDVGGPLAVYYSLTAAGYSPVTALILSGILPAIGVIVNVVRHHRLDAIGVLVLAGIIVGSILGLASHNPKLVLDEGSVSTGVFGLICLGSLLTATPLMYRLALQFTGPDSARGREFASLWRHPNFRHTFRVITAIWGVLYVLEAVARIIIVQVTTAGTGLATSKVMPYAVAAVAVALTVTYGRRKRAEGERLRAAASAGAGAGAGAAGPVTAGTVPAPARSPERPLAGAEEPGRRRAE